MYTDESNLLKELKVLINDQKAEIKALSNEVSQLRAKIDSLAANTLSEEEIFTTKPAPAPKPKRFFDSDLSKEEDGVIKSAKKLIYALLERYKDNENRAFAPMLDLLFSDGDVIAGLSSSNNRSIKYVEDVLGDKELSRQINFKFVQSIVYYIIRSGKYFGVDIKVNSVFHPGILDSGAVEDYMKRNEKMLKCLRDIIDA